MSLFNELKRRNVFRVTAAYVVVSWLLLQIGDVVFEALEVDASANRMLMAFVLLGLIPTIIFSWAFEMTPEGLKRDKDVPRDEQQDRNTAKKLDYVTMFVLVLVGGLSLWLNWDNKEADDTVELEQATNETSQKVGEGSFETSNLDNKSLAVLPFLNIAQTEDNEPFTVGIHDDLITHLSKISALKVISRTSVLKYKGSDKSIAEIANDLRVAHVLEGGVQRSGNQIRLNVQLVDVKTAEQLWAESFNRELTASNIFQIQSEISERIASALKAQLTDAEVVSLGKQQTDNLDAYNAYLAGRQRMLIRSSDALKEALVLFEKAANLDPNYALAYVGLADAWSLLNDYSDVSKEDMFEKGEPMLEKALSLDPMLAEAHTSKANYLREKNQFEAAINRFEYALTLNPNYATTYHWYGLLKSDLGDDKKALALYQKAAELDPLSPVIQTNIGYMLIEDGQIDAAIKQFDRIIELVPDYSGGPSGKSVAYAEIGQLDKAVEWQLKAVNTDPGNLSRRLDLSLLYIDLGLLDRAKAEINSVAQESAEFEALIYALATVDMYERNYDKAAQLFADKMILQPNNLSYRGNWTFYQMLLGNYAAAIESSLVMFPGDNDELYDIKYSNIDTTLNLIWMYAQVGEQNKSDNLLNRLKQFMAEYPEHYSPYAQAMIFAIEGNYMASAELFEQQFKSGDTRGFWRGAHLPMLKAVREFSETQKFLAVYDEKLAIQRNNVLALL